MTLRNGEYTCDKMMVDAIREMLGFAPLYAADPFRSEQERFGQTFSWYTFTHHYSGQAFRRRMR